jgi:hypothetical protein
MARAPSLSAKFAPAAASLSSTVAPRLATSIGAGLGMARAPQMSASLSSTVAPRLATSIGAGLGMARAPQLQGVDLRLDQFDLSEATHISWANDVKPLEECSSMGSEAFFACLDGSKQLLNDEDRALLKSIFHPALTDRRNEGDLFVPPSVRQAYVHKLRALVKEEESVRARRKETFLGKDFDLTNPGSLFPNSWTESFGVDVKIDRQRGVVQLCPEDEKQAASLLDVMKTGRPIFDKITEEGMKFRIYKKGSLEVRTTQEICGKEIIGAVFTHDAA